MKTLKNLKINPVKMMILAFFVIFVIGYMYANFKTFYDKNIVTIETTITNIEQYYVHKSFGKNIVGVKIEFTDENNNKYEYKGEITDKVYKIGDKKVIAYSQDDPTNIIIGIREGRTLSICFLIAIILIILFYYMYIYNKKSLILYIIFIICIVVNLIFINNIRNAIYIKMNYLRTDAYVVDTYTYSYTTMYSNTKSEMDGTREKVYKTGAIYEYNVNDKLYKGNMSDVSSETKRGDCRTVYYASENPIYYAFGVDVSLIVSTIALILITGFGILFNPFVDVLKKKKQNKKKK